MKRLLVAVAALVLVVALWEFFAPAPSSSSKSPVADAVLAPVAARSAVPSPRAATSASQSPPSTRTRRSGDVVYRASWGSGSGQLGHHVDPESAPVGPMALAAGPHGQLAILDQVNQRIVRLTLTSSTPRFSGTLPLPNDTAQDLLIDDRGRVAVLDRLGRGSVGVTVWSGDQPVVVPLVGSGIAEAGGVTGLFAGADGSLYAEDQHSSLVRIALPDGTPDPNRTPLAGRPRRDGQALLSAAIANAAAGQVSLTALSLDGTTTLWQATLQLAAPVLYLALVDSDRAGNSYVAAYVGRERTSAPFGYYDESVELTSLDLSGQTRGTLVLAPSGAHEEIFREFTVEDDGTIYRLVDTPDGVVVERYAF